MCSLRKIPTRLRGTNFCTSSEHLASSSIRQLNNPKCTQMVRNAEKHEFRVQQDGSGAFVSKIPTRLRGTNFCTSSERFAPSFTRQPNGRKWTKTVQNTPKYEFRFQWGGLNAFVAKKILLDFVARTFALVRPVLP